MLTREHKARLMDQWIIFLEQAEWQWFCTFTFRDPIHPEAADKLFRLWIRHLNRAAYGPRWDKKPHGCVSWVRALEWQKRGVLHYHALVACVPEREHMQKDKWGDKWNEWAGFARVDSYRSGGVIAYITKYILKGGEIDISKNMKNKPHYQLSTDRQELLPDS